MPRFEADTPKVHLTLRAGAGQSAVAAEVPAAESSTDGAGGCP